MSGKSTTLVTDADVATPVNDPFLWRWDAHAVAVAGALAGSGIETRFRSQGVNPVALASAQSHEPTDDSRKLVELLTAVGTSPGLIAEHLGLTPSALRVHYERELDGGLEKANARVAMALYRKAVIEDNLNAQIAWLKMRAGWREKDGDGRAVDPLLDVRGRTVEELQSEADAIRRRAEIADRARTLAPPVPD